MDKRLHENSGMGSRKKFPSLSCGISVVLNLMAGEEFQVSKKQGKVKTAWESGKATEVFMQTPGLQNERLSD